jgi:hypothetical protein
MFNQIFLLFLFLLSTASSAKDPDDLLFNLPLPSSIHKSLHQDNELDPKRWHKAGEEAMAKENTVKSMFSAVYFFTAATHVAPHRSQSWHNLAVSLSGLAGGFPAEASIVLLCESMYASLLADSLGNKSPSFVPNVLTLLKEYESEYPFLCEGLPGGKLQAMLTHAMELENDGHHIEATRLLCRSKKSTTIERIQPEIKRGVLTAATSRRAFITARICGVLRLSNAVDSSILNDVKLSIDEHWNKKESVIRAANAKRQIAENVKGNSSRPMFFESDDVAMRGDQKRYELQLEPTLPFTNPSLTNSPFLSSIIRLLTQDDELEIDTFSYVHSLPGSIHQPWHVDVEKLFRRSCDGKKNKKTMTDSFISSNGLTWDSKQYKSPFGIVAVVPLIDVKHEHGPTEFMTGSHITPSEFESYWEDTTTAILTEKMETTPRLKYDTKLSDVILFDLRLMHRGTPNVGDQSRSILYLSYVKSWYHDPSNFKRSQSQSFDQLKTKSMRKLFTRVDAKKYTKDLEKIIVKELGLSVLNKMKSKGNYTQRNVRL